MSGRNHRDFHASVNSSRKCILCCIKLAIPIKKITPALVQDIAPDTLRHRIGLTYEAEAEEITTDKIISQVLEQTPVPATQ